VVAADRPRIYLDWNATTPPHPEVLAEMAAVAERCWANPSSPHQAGRDARARIEEVRERIATYLSLHPRDVLFAGSGTEANNLALRGAGALVLSRMEHPSVVRSAEQLEAAGGLVRWVQPPESGRLEAPAILAALSEVPQPMRPACVVALAAANHETGVVQPVSEVAPAVRALGARLHCDAAQALGKLSPSEFSGADSYTLVGHKIRGPQGIAALAWRGAGPRPVVLGGNQERGLRPGTQSAALVAGFGAAFRRLDPERHQRLALLRARLEGALVPPGRVNGAQAVRLAHVSNLSFEGWSGERLVAALDLEGVCVSSGSACSVGTSQRSPVIEAMLGRARAEGAVRVSLGESTSEGDVEAAIATFIRVLGRRSSST
jgi:cysteine desulfurase